MNKLTRIKKASENWHNADIVAALHKAGWSLRKLSKSHGLGSTTLTAALHFPYPNGERLIADAIGVKPQEIWPTRYTKDGQPNRGRKMKGFKNCNAENK